MKRRNIDETSLPNSKIRNRLMLSDLLARKNEILLLSCDLLQCCMLYMEIEDLINFISSCKFIYEIFERSASEGVERRRVDILNKKSNLEINSRLLNLFSCPSDKENVMMTYDSYFRMKSLIEWPSKYYHDDKKFDTVCSLSEGILLNEKADQLQLTLHNLEGENKNYQERNVYAKPDSYYLSFDELVKRMCLVEPTGLVERAITPYSLETYQYIDSQIDSDHYLTRELIVRFFKKPQQMTFTDFEKEFKSYILDEIGILFIYDCVFEYNNTTRTRERFVVSGGCLLNCLFHCGMQDIDIYLINNGEDENVIVNAISTILKKFEEKTISLPSFKYNIMKSRTTINICPSGNIFDWRSEQVKSHHNFQIILLNFETIEELLLFFDLDCCKLAFDGKNVYTLPECLRALIKYKVNIMPKNSNTEVNFHRAIKYGKRGFKTVYVPYLDHPLSHLIHADYIISYLKDTTFYSNHYIQPSYKQYVQSMGRKLLDDDEVYLYPGVLKNVNYYFVELCIKKGLNRALRLLESNYSLQNIFSFICTEPERLLKEALQEEELYEMEPNNFDKIIDEVMLIDKYVFVKNPSELFQVVSNEELRMLVKEKYSDAHLRRKFNILRCDRCSLFCYSPSGCELKFLVDRDFLQIVEQYPEIMNSETFNKINEKIEGSDITRENYNYSEHILCRNCLKILGIDTDPIRKNLCKSYSSPRRYYELSGE